MLPKQKQNEVATFEIREFKKRVISKECEERTVDTEDEEERKDGRVGQLVFVVNHIGGDKKGCEDERKPAEHIHDYF